MEIREVVVDHIYREGNKLADYFANLVFYFAGSQSLTYSSVQDIPREARTILNMDRNQVPNLRIRKYQNRDYNNEDEQ